MKMIHNSHHSIGNPADIGTFVKLLINGGSLFNNETYVSINDKLYYKHILTDEPILVTIKEINISIRYTEHMVTILPQYIVIPTSMIREDGTWYIKDLFIVDDMKRLTLNP